MADRVRIAVRPMRPGDDLREVTRGQALAWVAHWWRDLSQGQDPDLIHWFTGELDGRPAGMAATLRAPAAAEGRAIGIVAVVPEARRQGLGTALLAVVEDSARTAGLPGVQLSWSEGDDGGEAAARAWSLREVARHRENVLDLTAIDRGDFAARARVAGIALATLGDALPDERWRALYAFFAARWREAPDSAGGGEPPPDPVFRQMLSGDPWSVVVATEDDQQVGLTCVSRRPGTDDVVNTFFTGVVPSARGRGIATALKCHQALLMADAGMTRLTTQNMDGNEPILAANRRLGFIADRGYVDVVRDL